MDTDHRGGATRHPFSVTLFRDARDVIPRQVSLTWSQLCELLAPAPPPVRSGVTAEVERQLALLDDVLRALLAGRVVDRFQRLGVHRELEKAIFKARTEGIAEPEVRDHVLARAELLRDGVRRRAKTRLACWSPTAYRPHETRGARGVEHVSCIVLDYDDGTTIEDAVAAWGRWPLIVHTSWSHTDAHPRFRLVLALAEAVPGEAWLRAWTWARERSGGHIDEACKDPSRLYLRPAIPRRDTPYRAFVRDDGGPLLTVDWRSLEDPRGGERWNSGTTSTVGARAASNGKVRAPEDLARQIARLRLRTDRATRERAAQWLNARIVGRRAERVLCPGCGRLSVWFWVEPGRQSTAICNHRNSCGWWGHLDELLDHQGAAHVG